MPPAGSIKTIKTKNSQKGLALWFLEKHAVFFKKAHSSAISPYLTKKSKNCLAIAPWSKNEFFKLAKRKVHFPKMAPKVIGSACRRNFCALRRFFENSYPVRQSKFLQKSRLTYRVNLEKKTVPCIFKPPKNTIKCHGLHSPLN